MDHNKITIANNTHNSIDEVLEFLIKNNHIVMSNEELQKLKKVALNDKVKKEFSSLSQQVGILSYYLNIPEESIYKRLGWTINNRFHDEDFTFPLVQEFTDRSGALRAGGGHWWGNVGLQTANKPWWFPLRTSGGISDSEDEVKNLCVIKDFSESEVGNSFNFHGDIGLIVAANNRLLFINRKNIKKYNLTEEGCDGELLGHSISNLDSEGYMSIPQLRLALAYYYYRLFPHNKDVIFQSLKGESIGSDHIIDVSKLCFEDFLDTKNCTGNEDEFFELFFNNMAIHYDDGNKENIELGDFTVYTEKGHDFLLNFYAHLINSNTYNDVQSYDLHFYDDEYGTTSFSMNKIAFIEMPIIFLLDMLRKRESSY